MGDTEASWASRHWPLIILGLWVVVAALAALVVWFALWCFDRGKKKAENDQLVKEITEASEIDRTRNN